MMYLTIPLQFAVAFCFTYIFVLLVMGKVINRKVLLRWTCASLRDKLDILMFWHVMLISMMAVLIHNLLLYIGI